MIEKTIYISQLFDYYKDLLTDRQREMLSLYYEEDYSLAEIGAHYDISRQGVYDNIKRGSDSLEHFEATLQLHQKAIQRLDLLQQLEDIDQSPQAMTIIKQLREII